VGCREPPAAQKLKETKSMIDNITRVLRAAVSQKSAELTPAMGIPTQLPADAG
jgi:hypothetical protein